jgi:hypothetical protein
MSDAEKAALELDWAADHIHRLALSSSPLAARALEYAAGSLRLRAENLRNGTATAGEAPDGPAT